MVNPKLNDKIRKAIIDSPLTIAATLLFVVFSPSEVACSGHVGIRNFRVETDWIREALCMGAVIPLGLIGSKPSFFPDSDANMTPSSVAGLLQTGHLFGNVILSGLNWTM